MRGFSFIFFFCVCVVSLVFTADDGLAASPSTPGSNSDKLTVKYQTQPAVGEPVRGISPADLELFKKGKKAFEKDFGLSAGMPANGFGPIANGTSCVMCHAAGAVGGGINGGSENVTRFGVLSGKTFDPLDGLGGSLLQKFMVLPNSTCPTEAVPTQANVSIKRVGLATFGAGFIEAIPDMTLLTLAQNQPPGLSGKLQLVKALEDPDGPDRVGKFGWKAQVPTILSFSADAANNEMGITNHLLPLENYPNTSTTNPDPNIVAKCNDGFDVGGVDDAGDFVGDLTNFMKLLSPPPQTPKSGMKGEKVFVKLGCAQCHTPALKTSNDTSVHPAIRDKIFKPYSDFLMHDMGDLGDDVVQGGRQASGREFRTPFLWGLTHRFGFMHDDRVFGGGKAIYQVANLDLAIAEHGYPNSEARKSANKYKNLTTADKNDLLKFLQSLGRREFDFTGDAFNNTPNDIINAADWAVFLGCYAAKPQYYTPDHDCAVGDINQDKRVDDTDLASLLTVYKGPIEDCQCDGVLDLVEIVRGQSADADSNASPDQCNMSLGAGGNRSLVANNGSIFVYATAEKAPANSQVEFFLSFKGQGNGGAYGSFCLNVASAQSIGTAKANSSGFASVLKSVALPPGQSPENFYIQSVVVGGNAKSNIMTGEITYP